MIVILFVYLFVYLQAGGSSLFHFFLSISLFVCVFTSNRSPETFVECLGVAAVFSASAIAPPVHTEMSKEIYFLDIFGNILSGYRTKIPKHGALGPGRRVYMMSIYD